MAGPLSEVQLASLPRCFRILVVCGPTGSGKSRIIGQLLQHFKLQEKQDDIIFKDNEAVCGHADLGDDFLEKLQAVGLNSVPSWLKPARCLSMGQRQRIESAIRASRNGDDGIVFDDFCAYVDDQSSFSCAASIWRLVKNNNGMNYVIVGTSRSQLIPYLGADIVIEAATGQILLNPLPFHERKLTVKMLPDEKLRFQFGKDQTQWHGVADEQPMQQTENYKRQATKVPFASSEKRYTSSVTMTSRTAEASEAFDLDFNGTVNQVVQVLQPRHLPDSWSIGALCGPSGSGKSVNMRNLGCEVVIQWRHGTPIHEQADSALLDIVLLPLAAQQRCYDDLSTGQKMQADLARQLAAGGRILVDEFTSVLDRTLAAALCISVESYVRRMNLQLIVATVHLDILQQLQPDWYFRSDSAQLMTFSKGTCDRPAVPAPCMDYFRPPVRSFTVSQLGGAKRTKEVFQAHFAQHHYLKQGLPAMWGLIVRDESGTAVAFHAVAWFTGCKAPREARVVVLPEYQGMGLGTRLSDLVGQLCLQSGYTMYAKTKHPRLGGYRNHRSDIWRPTAGNEKVASHSLQSSLRDMKERNKQVKGQQTLSFAPPKQVTLDVQDVEPQRKCFSHVYVGCSQEKPISTPKRKTATVETEDAASSGKKCPNPRRSRKKKAMVEE